MFEVSQSVQRCDLVSLIYSGIQTTNGSASRAKSEVYHPISIMCYLKYLREPNNNKNHFELIYKYFAL